MEVIAKTEGLKKYYGEGAGLDLQYVIPSGTFRELYPDNTLRKLYANVEDGQVDAMQEMLDTYTASVDRTLPVTSRQSMAQQYQEETRSSAVMGVVIPYLCFRNLEKHSVVERLRME